MGKNGDTLDFQIFKAIAMELQKRLVRVSGFCFRSKLSFLRPLSVQPYKIENILKSLYATRLLSLTSTGKMSLPYSRTKSTSFPSLVLQW